MSQLCEISTFGWFGPNADALSVFTFGWYIEDEVTGGVSFTFAFAGGGIVGPDFGAAGP
jgi:hypothetical protein